MSGGQVVSDSRSGYLLFVQTVVLLLLPLIHVVSGSPTLAICYFYKQKVLQVLLPLLYFYQFYFYFSSSGSQSVIGAQVVGLWISRRHRETLYQTWDQRSNQERPHSRIFQINREIWDGFKNGPFQSPRPSKESTWLFSYFLIHIKFRVGWVDSPTQSSKNPFLDW